MNHQTIWLLTALLALGICRVLATGSRDMPLVQRQWFETRTAHFNIYSCSAPEEVDKLAAQLEQFCEAYALLAGAQAVASPPIVVMAFPDHKSLKPFLPLYHDRPGHFAGLFQHSSDENLIVLSLPGANADATDMTVVFHKYAHLLFRRNDRIWPLWLKEGMAEIYSTFETSGYNAVIGQPIEHHLRLLAKSPLLPLTELFAVTHDSPQYSERERQGIFYAESWLLTHYLMAGDNPVYKSRFGQFTTLLRDGQMPVPAFTNALQITLPPVESDLRRYQARGQFAPVQLAFSGCIAQPRTFARRNLVPVENYFRLGDELLRLDRLDDAEKLFNDAQKLAPASPLPHEGLGLLAVQREKSEVAEREFREALRLGSASFLAYYLHAWEQYRLQTGSAGPNAPLPKETAEEIHGELLRSIVLMPNFGPAHELFGIFELAQDKNFTLAEQHLEIAVKLEPENPHYLLALANAQLRNKNPEAARRTLTTLLLPTVEAKVRRQAGELIQKISKLDSGR
jgi:tetratricopeptide (TPR) repeat protein